MNVVAYVRVSTDRQAEHGYGLDVQRASIKQWAKANGHAVSLWAADEGVSGSNGLDSRVGLFDAMTAITEGQVGGLVVAKLDRLARDLILQETLIGLVTKAGGRVFSTVPSESDLLDSTGDGDDPARKMVRQILGSVAEYERAVIRLRLRSGKLAKKAKGGYIGGRIPLGYEQDASGTLVPNEREKAAVARMVELRNGGSTLQAICDALTAEGFETRTGGRWHTAVVGRVLERQRQSNS